MKHIAGRRLTMSNIYQVTQIEVGSRDALQPKKKRLNIISPSLCKAKTTCTTSTCSPDSYCDAGAWQPKASTKEKYFKTSRQPDGHSENSPQMTKREKFFFVMTKEEKLMISPMKKNIFREGPQDRLLLLTNRKHDIDEDQNLRPKIPSRNMDTMHRPALNRQVFDVKDPETLETCKQSVEIGNVNFDIYRMPEPKQKIVEKMSQSKRCADGPFNCDESDEKSNFVDRNDELLVQIHLRTTSSSQVLSDTTPSHIEKKTAVSTQCGKGPVHLDEHCDNFFQPDHITTIVTNGLSLNDTSPHSHGPIGVVSPKFAEKKKTTSLKQWPLDGIDETLVSDQTTKRNVVTTKTEIQSEKNKDDYSDDNFDDDSLQNQDFDLFIPEALDLMNPISFDVMTCTSGDSGILTIHTNLDDEAFNGELWNQMHVVKKSFPTSEGTWDAEKRLQTKYNKYRNLQTPIEKNNIAELAQSCFFEGNVNGQTQLNLQILYDQIHQNVAKFNESNIRDLHVLREQIHSFQVS